MCDCGWLLMISTIVMISLKGVVSDQRNMCGIVAFWFVIITAFSFFHNFLYFFKASIPATSFDHNACFNTIYTVECLQSVTVVVSGCGSCDPEMWMLCSKDVNVVGKRCASWCRNGCRQKIKRFSVKRIWASYLESLKATYIKFSFSTKDSL